MTGALRALYAKVDAGKPSGFQSQEITQNYTYKLDYLALLH